MSDNDLEINSGADYDMDNVDDMPAFVNEIDGVYKCSLTLKRDTEPRNDKETDTIIFGFTIQETIEEKKDHGVCPEDIVYCRFSLIKSKRDIDEKKKESFGLRMAKPYLVALKDALNCGSSLNEIIKEAQDVQCTVTFATRTSNGKDKEGNAVEYKNIDIKKLIIA